MTQGTLLASVALLLGALAILPGTLGVVSITHKLAATAGGARLIYRQSRWVVLASAVLMIVAVSFAWRQDAVTAPLAAVSIAYAGILVFGFLMHVGLNFKPVRNPEFISIERAIEKFGADEEVVGVIDAEGKAFAFITRLARRPHVVYQPDGNSPFIMSHCILAHSSMSYAMRGNFSDPDILVVAVIANNLVFYEKNSRCAVIQIHNRAREGGLDLEPLDTVAVSLKTWQSLYPESPVWLRRKEWRDTFYLKLLARADIIDPESPVMIYPTEQEVDRRLPMKSQVLGVEADGEACAYPVDRFRDTRLINDQLGERFLLIAAASEGDYIQVFDREIEPGRVLEFVTLEYGAGFSDIATHSVWSPTGKCTSGELSGQRLATVPHYNKIFWYVWADFHSGTRVWSPEQNSEGIDTVNTHE